MNYETHTVYNFNWDHVTGSCSCTRVQINETKTVQRIYSIHIHTDVDVLNELTAVGKTLDRKSQRTHLSLSHEGFLFKCKRILFYFTWKLNLCHLTEPRHTAFVQIRDGEFPRAFHILFHPFPQSLVFFFLPGKLNKYCDKEKIWPHFLS